MTNSENERNIYEINYRLFELITFMSESERRELQSAIISNLSENKKAGSSGEAGNMAAFQSCRDEGTSQKAIFNLCRVFE
jgi:hypothetical protein